MKRVKVSVLREGVVDVMIERPLVGDSVCFEGKLFVPVDGCIEVGRKPEKPVSVPVPDVGVANKGSGLEMATVLGMLMAGGIPRIPSLPRKGFRR